MKVQLYQVTGGECHLPAAGDLLLIERGVDHVTQYLKWSTLLACLDVTKAYVDAQDALFLKLDGSRPMTGALVLANAPMNDNEAATKQYVDIQFGYAQQDIASKLSRFGGTMENELYLSADPVADLQAATKRYVDVAAALAVASQLAGKLSVSGGTMAGELILFSDPLIDMQAATKQYVDMKVYQANELANSMLPKAGGTMNGALILSGIVGVDPYEAVSKHVLDATLANYISKYGGAMQGALLLQEDISEWNEAVHKTYVDNAVASAVNKSGDIMSGSLKLAPVWNTTAVPCEGLTIEPNVTACGANSTLITVRYNGQPVWTLYPNGEVLNYGRLVVSYLDPQEDHDVATKYYVDHKDNASYLKVDGSRAMTGPLTLSAAPSLDLHAATKGYVDGQLSEMNTSVGSMLPKSGGTMTGVLTLAADPTSNLHAATKQYVDNHAAAPATAGTTNYAASLALDFNGNSYQTITLTGDLTITGTSNRASAKAVAVRLIGDASSRNLAFPAGWKFFGAKPASIAAGKEAILSLTCFGANETDVRAAYAAEQ